MKNGDILCRSASFETARHAKAKARRITFGSDDYFTLVEEQPELQPFFALGEQVIVVIKGQAYIVEAA